MKKKFQKLIFPYPSYPAACDPAYPVTFLLRRVSVFSVISVVKNLGRNVVMIQTGFAWQHLIKIYDERRDIALPGDFQATIQFSIEHFIYEANRFIAKHGYFAVALSGGSTPKAIYEGLASKQYADKIDWSRVLLFWSDERSVPQNHPDNNYRMALEAAFGHLPLNPANIFPMRGDGDIQKNAAEYERLIEEKLPNKQFDLVMLGVGEDGHTASLFPKTHGLHPQEDLVVANFVPQKNTWRLTLTFKCINSANNIVIYALGKGKAEIVKRVFNGNYEPDLIPAQRIGTASHKALWVLDNDAAAALTLSNP